MRAMASRASRARPGEVAFTFRKGAITSGCPDDKAVDDAIQANIVTVGYGK
jgi:hypothetical protein